MHKLAIFSERNQREAQRLRMERHSKTYLTRIVILIINALYFTMFFFSLCLGDPINRVGLEDCEVCQTRPCKNGGTCTEVAEDWGFVCSCRPGYSGRTCHSAGQRCSPGVCNEGRCENVGDDGFRCICPAGYSGEKCEKGLFCLNHKNTIVSMNTLK